jgi:predicted PolB exonuclease-like 3'-5' exonuclease
MGVDEEGSLQEFEQQVLASIAHSDPLPAIKNSADSSHFQLMKTYLTHLSLKLNATAADNKHLEKRYRSLKEKFAERAEKAIVWEEQNKLLRGKV